MSSDLVNGLVGEVLSGVVGVPFLFLLRVNFVLLQLRLGVFIDGGYSLPINLLFLLLRADSFLLQLRLGVFIYGGGYALLI